MATFGFNADGLISEFQTKLDEMASIWSVSIFPPNCKAEVRDFLKENKSATFYVKLRDFQNVAPFKENRNMKQILMLLLRIQQVFVYYLT